MEKNNKKKNFFNLLLFIALIFGGVWASNNLIITKKSNNDGFKIENKELESSDYEIELDSGNWTSVYVNLTAKRGIKEIKLKVEYYDKNDMIVKTEIKTFHDLDSSKTYKFEFKNSLLEITKINKWRVIVLSGERK